MKTKPSSSQPTVISPARFRLFLTLFVSPEDAATCRPARRGR